MTAGSVEEIQGLLKAEAGAPGGSSWQLLKRIGPVAVVSAMMHIFMMLEVHIYVPYLYTRVRCCTGPLDQLGADYDITEPDMIQAIQDEASTLDLKFDLADHGRIEACSVPTFPRDSKHWSMSPQCPNKAFVQQSTQGVMATMKPLQKLFCFFVLPIGGALADAIGRTPVLGLYVGGLLLACLISAADAYTMGAWGNSVVYMAGCLFGLSFQPKDSILAGTVADMMGEDEVAKGRTFVALRTVDAAFSFLVNIIVYMYLRRHNASHCCAWLAFAGVASTIMLVIIAGMKETLPMEMRKPLSSDMLNPLVSQFKALRLVCRDSVLILQCTMVFFFYCYFLGYITTRTSYLTLIGFRMEQAMLPEILAQVVVFGFSALMMPLLPKIGIWNLSTLGNLMFATGYAFVGPFTILVSTAGPYISGPMLAMGVLVTFPAFQTIVSQRVEQENQSKCQAAISAVGTLGAVIGIPLYNKYLFDATAHGLNKARCPIVCFFLASLCAVLSMFVTCLARKIPGAGSPQVAPKD